MQKRSKGALIAAALAAGLLVITLLQVRCNSPKKQLPPETNKPQPGFFTQADPAGVPEDVRQAAEALKTSRVGYAMRKADKTYLVISTGSPADRVKFDRVEGQPDLVTPALVDIHLTANLTGESLMIGSTPLTVETEYQFDVDGRFADIPTLHNRHNLPLIPLDARTGFSLVTPQAGHVAEGGVLHVEGYARVFEAQFTARVETADGRVLGGVPVMAAAGAPSWGSFAAHIEFYATGIPDAGFLVLEEEMTGAKLRVPIRFRRPPQMG